MNISIYSVCDRYMLLMMQDSQSSYTTKGVEKAKSYLPK